jgi:hypothetical protein
MDGFSGQDGAPYRSLAMTDNNPRTSPFSEESANLFVVAAILTSGTGGGPKSPETIINLYREMLQKLRAADVTL